MNCLAFDRLLDAGAPEALAPQALAHAAGCERCGRALAAARSLERALQAHLGAPSLAAPHGFADRVLARIEVRRRMPLTVQPGALPWWVGIAAQPAAAGALAIAALLAWRGPWLWSALTRELAPGGAWSLADGAAASRALAWSRPFAAALQPVTDLGWAGSVALVVALAPVALLAGYALYQAAERLCEGPVRA